MAKLYRLLEYEWDETNESARDHILTTLEKSLSDGPHQFGTTVIRARTVRPVAELYSIVIQHTDEYAQQAITIETFIPETELGILGQPKNYEQMCEMAARMRKNKSYHSVEVVRIIVEKVEEIHDSGRQNEERSEAEGTN